jgi:hypothetical protein
MLIIHNTIAVNANFILKTCNAYMIQNTKNNYVQNHTLAAIIGTGVTEDMDQTEGQSFALCH